MSSRARRIKRAFSAPAVIVAFFLASSVSFAGDVYERCFTEAGNSYNISPLLLWSIAKHESRFNPAAVNRNRNGTYDFGVMQINSSWYGVLGHERWMSLGDPVSTSTSERGYSRSVLRGMVIRGPRSVATTPRTGCAPRLTRRR